MSGLIKSANRSAAFGFSVGSFISGDTSCAGAKKQRSNYDKNEQKEGILHVDLQFLSLRLCIENQFQYNTCKSNK
jgi:hypothetical protein